MLLADMTNHVTATVHILDLYSCCSPSVQAQLLALLI